MVTKMLHISNSYTLMQGIIAKTWVKQDIQGLIFKNLNFL